MPQIAKGNEEFLGATTKVTRTSVSSGTTRTIELPITKEQYDDWKGGAMIQDAMPQLLAWQREFLMTGMTNEEWDQAWGDDE